MPLKTLKHPLAICDVCPLYDQPYVPSHIPEGASVMAVGEAPGMEETLEGVPFVGPSGKLLDIVIENNGHDPSKLAKTNVVSCRPPNNRTPTDGEIECCRRRLEHEIEGWDTILALGKTAALTLTGRENTKFTVGTWYNERIITTWHPAFVLRSPGAAQRMITDVRRAFEGYQEPPDFVTRYPEVRWVRSVRQLEEELAECPEGAWVAFDFETDNVVWYDRPDKRADAVLQYGLAWSEDFGIVLQDDMLYDVDGTIEVLQEFHDREDVLFVGQNAKFDVIFARSHFGLNIRADFDTMLAHYILDENSRHGLKELAADEFGMPDYEKALVQKYLKNRNDSYSKVPEEDLAQYLVLDLAVTRELGMIYSRRLLHKGLLIWPFKNIMMRGHNAMVEQEMMGLKIDRPYLLKAQKLMEDKLAELQAEAAKMAGWDEINLNSPQQVAKVVYDQMKFPPCKVRKLKPRSTAQGALIDYVGTDEFIDLLFFYRRIHKLKSSYLDNMLEFADVDGYVHPTVWIHGTEMGRLSMRDPAAQTIPRPGQKIDFPVGHKYFDSPYTSGAIIRGAVIPPEGKALIVADYSQAELRTAAALSGDEFLLEVYRDGRDLHTEVALAMYGEDWTKEQRVRTKMFNFSYLYGGNEYSFAMDAGLPISQARQFVREYNEVMPQLAQYRIDQYNYLLEHGHVTSRTGRRRRFPLITNQNKDEARKAAVHMPIASLASDLTFLTACQLIEEGHEVRLTVHDSVLVTCDIAVQEEVAAYVEKVMNEKGQEIVPEVVWKADAEIRTRWAEPPSF